MVNRYVMVSAALTALIAGSALAGPGVSTTITLTPNSGSVSTNWSTNAINRNFVVPAGNWVSARESFVSTGTSSISSFGVAFANAAPSSGTGSTATYPGGTTVYANTGAQALSQPNTGQVGYNANFWGQHYNIPFASTPAAGSTMFYTFRAAATGQSVTNLTLTLFQRATADIAGTLATTDPTFIHAGTVSSGAGNGTNSSLTSNGAGNYRAYDFTVDTTGTYLMSIISGVTGGSNGIWGTVYEGASGSGVSGFNPATPGANVLRSGVTTFSTTTTPSVGGVLRDVLTQANGFDVRSGGVPGMTLQAGRVYTVVVSANSNTFSTTNPTLASGNFEVYFEGPGTVSIPTPGAMALMGLGGLAMTRRRR